MIPSPARQQLAMLRLPGKKSVLWSLDWRNQAESLIELPIIIPPWSVAPE
jgi:hypothetical protein